MTEYDQLEPIEKASIDELRTLQLDRLKQALKHAYESVPHYRRKFDEHGVRPEDLKRLEDLPELTRLFIERYRTRFHSPVKGISDSALKILATHRWPGNIRELENLMERLVAMSDKEWITDEDLPLDYHFAKLDSGPSPGETLFQEACDTFERNFILRALERSDWNVTATARYLGIPLSTLKHKMARLDLRDLARKLRGA